MIIMNLKLEYGIMPIAHCYRYVACNDHNTVSFCFYIWAHDFQEHQLMSGTHGLPVSPTDTKNSPQHWQTTKL